MKIQIKSADVPQKWYANKIGEVFEVDEEMTENYLVINPEGIKGATYGVRKDNCEIYKEKPKTIAGIQRKLF